jgi:thymidylate synthase
MFMVSGQTADDAWRSAAALFKPDGPSKRHFGRGGDTQEILHVGLTIERPRERWIVSRTPAMNPAFALVEVFWIAAGRRDAALPLYWNPRLAEFCGAGSTYHGAYGHRLRRHFGVDQLDRVYVALQAAPHTRQAVLQIWDGAVDLPNEVGTPADLDIPCNVVALPKVRNGKLEWMQVIRSNDLFLGLPHNVVQFTCLQEMLAGWLGIAVGAYHQLSDSLHVYSKDLGAVRSSIRPLTLANNSDSLALDRRSWDEVMRLVLDRLDQMTTRELTPHELRSGVTAGG